MCLAAWIPNLVLTSWNYYSYTSEAEGSVGVIIYYYKSLSAILLFCKFFTEFLCP